MENSLDRGEQLQGRTTSAIHCDRHPDSTIFKTIFQEELET
jgi:hypothetical protein